MGSRAAMQDPPALLDVILEAADPDEARAALQKRFDLEGLGD